jgi:hypothetical protein
MPAHSREPITRIVLHRMRRANVRRTLTAALCVIAVVACGGGDGAAGPAGGGGPRTRVPDELVGTWFSGDVSPTEFYNPHTGHWGGNGYGQGVFYRFSADGSYEYGYQNWSELYGCGTQTMFYVKGTMEVDETVRVFVLHPTSAKRFERNTCAGTETEVNYRDEGESDYYQVRVADDGTIELWTRYTDGSDDRWYRARKVDW